MAKYITTNDICELFKVTRTTVINWRKDGMPYEKLGKLVRFEEEKVTVWLRDRGREVK